MRIINIVAGAAAAALLGAQGVHAESSPYFRDEALTMAEDQFRDVRGISLGEAVTLKTTVSQTLQYDSNILLAATDKKQDFISITSPKVLLDAPLGTGGRHNVQLMYGADMAAFSNHTDQNFVNQEFNARGNFLLSHGHFNVQNDFRDTSDRANTEFTNLVRRAENLTQVAAGLDGGRLSYETTYSHFLRSYRGDSQDDLDYNEDFLAATVLYQVLPKTRALLEYDHGFIDYPNDSTRDGGYDQVRTGVVLDVTAKTTGTVKVGYQNRSYDIEGRSGFSGFVADARVRSELSERTGVELKYISTAVESIDSSNNYYDSNLLGASVSQKVLDKFTVSAGTQYERRNYPETDASAFRKRRDNVVTDSIGVRYDFKDWSRASLGYSYLADFSNIHSDQYKDHLVTLRFDFLI